MYLFRCLLRAIQWYLSQADIIWPDDSFVPNCIGIVMAQNIFQRKSAKSLKSKNASKTFCTQSFKSSSSYCKYSRAPSLYAVLEKLKKLDAIGNSLIFLNHVWESRPRIYITPPAFHFVLFLNRVRYCIQYACTLHNKGRKLAQFWVHACLTLHSLQSRGLLLSLFTQECGRGVVWGGGGVRINY